MNTDSTINNVTFAWPKPTKQLFVQYPAEGPLYRKIKAYNEQYDLPLPSGSSAWVCSHLPKRADVHKSEWKISTSNRILLDNWVVSTVNSTKKEYVNASILPSLDNFTDTAFAFTRNAVTYQSTFELANRPKIATINLGRVEQVAYVFVNEKFVGCRWAHPYQLIVEQKYMRKGANQIKVIVIPNGWNAIVKTERQNPNWKIFEDINFVDINYKPFDKENAQLFPNGLHEPVYINC